MDEMMLQYSKENVAENLEIIDTTLRKHNW